MHGKRNKGNSGENMAADSNCLRGHDASMVADPHVVCFHVDADSDANLRAERKLVAPTLHSNDEQTYRLQSRTDDFDHSCLLRYLLEV